MPDPLIWTDVDELGYQLSEKHPDIDPFTLPFPALRQLVESLDNFSPLPGHDVNEQILEAIQQAWHDERDEANGD